MENNSQLEGIPSGTEALKHAAHMLVAPGLLRPVTFSGHSALPSCHTDTQLRTADSQQATATTIHAHFCVCFLNGQS